jgi:3-isopropylmalate dehydrogenase
MTRKILLLSGDGVGTEIMQELEKIIAICNKYFSTNIECEKSLIGGAAIDDCNNPLPQNTLDLAKDADGVLLGAVGGPKWDAIDLELRPEKALLKLRKELGLFANLRPALMFPELLSSSSLKPEYIENLDMLTVRELTGGIYYGEPRGIVNNKQRSAHNTMVYSEFEIQRVAKVAFELAQKRSKKLCSVDKANVLEVSRLWREVVSEMSIDYPDVSLTHMYVDNAAMQLVRDPKQFDVLLTGNLFGDILSDCSAMLTGSIGMLPSASLNKGNVGMFEPVHGSAPDIAGKNIVNPCAMILSFAMMLEYSLDNKLIADNIKQSISNVLSQKIITKDLVNNSNTNFVSTSQMGESIAAELIKLN